MSHRPHLVFEPDVQNAISQYIVDLFVQESAAQHAITTSTTDNGLPQIDLRSEEGWMLYVMTRLVGAKRAIEFGTLGGYSATWIAKGLGEDGYLLSLELSQDHATIARKNLKAAGLEGRVEVRVGDAHQIIESLNETFDLAFLDAEKTGNDHYLTWALDHVRPGGLIVAHNPFRHGAIVTNDDGVNTVAMKKFLARVAADERLVSTIIPVGDGLLIALVQ